MITVSPAIAQRLRQEHALDRMPEVVLNIPDVRDGESIEDDIRSRAGLPADVPLLVYSGIIPMLPAPNHQMALPNKLFEYSLSRKDSYRLGEPAFRQEIAWSAQAAKLRTLYGELFDRDLTAGAPADPSDYERVSKLL
ncbi:hypothetical protein ACXJJ3_31575 [Kribbella sp. WER1]